MIEISTAKINESALLDSVRDPACGAAVVFSGMTRQWTENLETQSLQYECYEEMARHQMQRLADRAMNKWDVRHVAIQHRIGSVDIGETSLAIAVSSPHRRDALESAGWLIDTLKTDVPIWKKEHYTDGSVIWQENKP